MPGEINEDACYVALTEDHLDAKSMMDRVRSAKAGAIVLFAGNVPCLVIRPELTIFPLKVLRVITLLGSPSRNFNIPPTNHVHFKACLQYASLSKRSIHLRQFQ
jgi:hypothetical protein